MKLIRSLPRMMATFDRHLPPWMNLLAWIVCVIMNKKMTGLGSELINFDIWTYYLHMCLVVTAV